MSNNNLDNTLIKTTINSLYIEELSKTFKETGINLLIEVKEDNISLILELPKSLNFAQQIITNNIKYLLQEKFSISKVQFIFTNKADQKESSRKIKHTIPNVRKIILFAATKGGVGKSTTATNTALALAELGYKTGLVDADIYGPTIPKLLNIKEKPSISENKMIPIEKHKVHSISIGYLIDETQATIWRGPMISKALYQLLLGVKWPELDYLIIDMPPGTGDIYLSLAENFIIDGAILITTPQKIAIDMLQKSINFFNKTNIPIIGVIENMSFFYDEANNLIHKIFGENLDESMLKKLNTTLLAQIALMPKVTEFSDKGKILLLEKEFEIYKKIAEKLSCFSTP